MTILTPTFAQLNGAGGAVRITPAHEPTKIGEQPLLMDAVLRQFDPSKAEIVPPVGPLKIALVGTAPSSKGLAPVNDPSWKIWGCSPGNMNQIARVDAWFELHSNLLWPEHEAYGRPYIEWLKQQSFPVYMQDTWPTLTGDRVPLRDVVPNAIPFPRSEMVAMFGPDFFTSSFAWMMALAISMGAAEIALYGIDMASRDEYIRQRPGFYYFRQRARERGVKISAPHESDIMQSPPLYGYVDSTPMGRKVFARIKEVDGRVTAMTQQRDQLNHNITYLQGAKEDLDYIESIWGGISTDLITLQDENAALRAMAGSMQARIAELEKAMAPTDPSPVSDDAVSLVASEAGNG